MDEVGAREWRCPEDRLYHPDHLWVLADGDAVVIGVTDYLQRTAGSVLYVTFPEPGRRVEAGEEICSLEAAKWVGHFPAPVDGVVAGVNSALAEKPGLLNGDPYGEGWLVRLVVRDPGALPGSLMTAGAYRAHVERLEREEAGAW